MHDGAASVAVIVYRYNGLLCLPIITPRPALVWRLDNVLSPNDKTCSVKTDLVRLRDWEWCRMWNVKGWRIVHHSSVLTWMIILDHWSLLRQHVSTTDSLSFRNGNYIDFWVHALQITMHFYTLLVLGCLVCSLCASTEHMSFKIAWYLEIARFGFRLFQSL